MIPAAFALEVPGSVEEAVGLLAQGGEDARPLAGGHSLLPLMKLRLAAPRVLVDLRRLDELRFVEDRGDHLAIGALTPLGELVRDGRVRKGCGLLADAARLVGTPQVRHVGTLGGSLAHGDPAGDLGAVALALEADVVVRGPGGERVVPATGLFQDFLETALAPDELLCEVRVPKLAPGPGWAYQKFTRRALDWATVGVVAVVEHADGAVSRARLAMVNMGSTPLRAPAAEAALAGVGLEEAPRAAEAAGQDGDPPSDLNGSAEYRRHLAGVLARRAVGEALGRPEQALSRA